MSGNAIPLNEWQYCNSRDKVSATRERGMMPLQVDPSLTRFEVALITFAEIASFRKRGENGNPTRERGMNSDKA